MRTRVHSASWLPSSAAWLRGFVIVMTAVILQVNARAQENHPPSGPGEVAVSEITAHSARISWAAATDPDGDPLVYLVSIRKRLEGVAQSWSLPQETRGLSVIWDGLPSRTTYDVRVVASDGKVAGPARVRELAFTTLAEVEGNHAPTLPGPIQVTDIGAHAVRISWGASTDQDGDVVSYLVAVRKRTEGVLGEWSPAVAATATSLLWDGLQAETSYDVRVRASDGKSLSNWLVKESAFRTLTEPGAPSKPGEISVTDVTRNSARITWGPASGPMGVTLSYSVQVRARTNDVPSAWRGAGETTTTSLTLTGLAPGTVYDVQVRARANSVGSLWDLKEKAFKTLLGEQINHPPTVPGPLAVAELTPYSVRLSWGPSSDSDGDAITYAVCLRKRLEGVAQPWSDPREVEHPAIFWDGLSPNTLYEVRIRAWDGRAASDWYVKESAFRTPAPGPNLAGFAQGADPAGAAATGKMIVIWPNATGATVLEASESVLSPQWNQCQEVETDGTQTRSLVPLNGNAGFFRVR